MEYFWCLKHLSLWARLCREFLRSVYSDFVVKSVWTKILVMNYFRVY